MTQTLARDTSVQMFLQPFAMLMADESITEIAVNRPGEVWFEKNSKWHTEKCEKVTTELIKALGVAVATYSEQDWTRETPLLSASLPDGSRIQLVRPPAVEEDRYSFTLRRPSRKVRTLEDYGLDGLFKRVRPVTGELSEPEKELKVLLEEQRYQEFMAKAVHARMNIVVSGATGSGKTTFMKGLVKEIPLEERLITIEDTRELFVPHGNAVHLLYSKGGQSGAKVEPKDLLQCCLRMKPDRILLAELRGDESLYYVRQAASGHPGSITSLHGGSAALAFEQMAIMIQDSRGGANLTFDVIKRLLILTVDVIVQFQNREGERFISEIYYKPERKLEAMA